MAITDTLKVSYGSIAGRHHIGDDRNIVAQPIQDAVYVHTTPEVIIGVVCDGMGSGINNQLGAQIGGRLFMNTVLTYLYDSSPVDLVEDIIGTDNCTIFSDLLANRLDGIARQLSMGELFCKTNMEYLWNIYLNENMFFTLIGFISTPSETVILGCGDGFIYLNGERCDFGPAPGEYPSFFSERLLSGHHKKDRTLEVIRRLPTHEVQNLLVSTDGLRYWLSNQDKPIYGGVVGPVDQLWTDDFFFTQRTTPTLRLRMMQRIEQKVDWTERRINRQGGYLEDDLALITMKRFGE